MKLEKEVEKKTIIHYNISLISHVLLDSIVLL